ncbi:MAG: hypothetical protein A3F11_10840 [Gammaproteobacteria bacterium RIFCSPHIGHO2_12_FULL_37_14]|nr:MAG: hypothetical protein A3F11_10840 [Gammaproteobacteria bacterium RIFCSPHIGHO2_12_FULL_37_14]
MLDLECKLSKRFLSLALIVILISAGMVMFIPVTIKIQLMMIFFIFAYGGWVSWHFILLRGRYSLLGIKHVGENHWILHTPAHVFSATLCGDSTATPWVSVLRFNIPGQFWKKSCVIFPDALSRDAYRKLLVVLRMG